MKNKRIAVMVLVTAVMAVGSMMTVSARPDIDREPRMEGPAPGEEGPGPGMEGPAPEGPAPEMEVWETETETVQMTSGESGTNLEGVAPSTEWTTESESYEAEDSVYVEGYLVLGKESAEVDFDLFAVTDLPETMYLEVPEIWQKPELPTGCESVALTMALMFEGFDLEKTTIARDYLLYNREDDNMAIGYVGDPFSDSGAGCYPPALAATAMAFFEDVRADYSAYDVTGSTLEELFAYVAIGRPVIIWGSMYMMEPQFSGDVAFFEGKEYYWYNTEHCMVLSGYDLKSQTVVINDPLEGIVTRDLSEFERLFNLTGQNAVVLKANI